MNRITVSPFTQQPVPLLKTTVIKLPNPHPMLVLYAIFENRPI